MWLTTGRYSGYRRKRPFRPFPEPASPAYIPTRLRRSTACVPDGGRAIARPPSPGALPGTHRVGSRRVRGLRPQSLGRVPAWLVVCVWLLACLPIQGHAAQKSLKASKPFAQHFLALQLSDGSPAKQKEVLDVANNMLKFYGTDNIAIDVVTFGPGVRLLFAKNKNAKMVNSLAVQGVRFDICENTLKTIKRDKGSVPALNPHATKVQAGVARIMSLVKAGFILVRP